MKISPCYCITLRNASNAISKIYDQQLEPFNLTIRQYSLLINVGRIGSANMTTISDITSLDRTSLVRMLRPLLDRGLIEDSAGKGKRDRCIRLTDSGRALLAEAKPAWQAAQDEIEAKLGKENIDRLMDMIKML